MTTKKKFHLRDITSELFEKGNRASIRAVFQSLLSKGHTPEEAREVLAEMIDELLDFDELIKGPVGVAIEQVDGHVIRLAIRLITAFAARKR